MLAHVLKNSESHAETYLRTSYYLEVLDKFKGFPNEQVELAQAALDQADPADDRVSMLWTKVCYWCQASVYISFRFSN